MLVNNKLKNIPVCLISTIAILLLFILLINSTQTTLCRYMTNVDGKAAFVFRSKQNLMLIYDQWEETEGEQTLLFDINNIGANNKAVQGGAVRIRVYTPKIEELSMVRISIGDEKYTANISEVPEGTVVYNEYGDGNIYRFYGEDGETGEELYFDLPSSDSLSATLILIAENPVDTTDIQILVEPVNTQEKGGNQE